MTADIISSDWGNAVHAALTSPTREVLSLGDVYISDFLAPGEQPRSDPWPLTVVMDPDGLVHLGEQPPAELMWGRYWYRSGTNATMTAALGDVVDATRTRVAISAGDLWVDIACNDGTLLRLTRGAAVERVGVDPAEDSIAREAAKWCNHYQTAFDSTVAGKIRAEWGPAKVITCVAMFYDLMDPTDFLAGVVDLLADDGVFVLQLSYTPLMLEQLAFDNVCHEHARYYTLVTLMATLRAAGFKLVDAELNDVNGGSLRVYAMREDADVTTFGSASGRDVAAYRAQALINHEMFGGHGYNYPGRWFEFRAALTQLRHDTHTLITDLVASGKTVYGYGASTKGNTLLQYFGLDRSLITAIAERQPGKVGLRTVGTDIPIVSEAEARAAMPDYMLVLPWHFRSEFVRREADYLKAGGRLIFPCPRLEVVSS